MDNLVQLDGVTNFRDVGKTVNQFLGKKLVFLEILCLEC